MIRRVLGALLVATIVASAIPPAAFAAGPTQQPGIAVAPRVSILASPVRAFDLQQATEKAIQGVVLEKPKSARQESGPFLKTGAGKATLAAAILVTSVFICYRMVQGPDPTSASAR